MNKPQRIVEISHETINIDTSVQFLLRSQIPMNASHCKYDKGLLFHICNLINSMSSVVQS